MSLDISKCKNLNIEEQYKIAKKLNIPKDKIDNTNNLCSIIKKYYNKKYPCNDIIKKDTTLKLKTHQLSVANQMINTRGIIVYHEVGTGKTLTSIITSRCLLLSNIIKNCIIVTPTSLQENAKKEMRKYNDKLDIKKYHFYTITSLVNAIKNKDIISPKNSLIIIDEAHNLRKLDGTLYTYIYEYCLKAEKILLLTATPLINYKYDIINLVSLVKGEPPISKQEFYEIEKSPPKLKKYLKDVFNIYEKTIETHFPNKTVYEVFLPMTKSYYELYKKVERGEIKKLPDFKDNQNIFAFYNGVRRSANIIGDKSIKINWVYDKILENPRSKFVIYSNYIDMGMKPIMNRLDKKKIKYSYITGEMSISKRKEAVDNYNSGNIKILFISKSGAEGLDLKNTNYMIVLEPTWNDNLLNQIIGRVVRYKSHSDLKKSKQKVSIYRLFLVKPKEYNNIDEIIKNLMLDYKDDILSIDLYLKNFSSIKQIEIDNFYNTIKKLSN